MITPATAGKKASQQDNYGHHRINGVIHHSVALTFLNMLGHSMQSESLKHYDLQEFFKQLPIDTAMEAITPTHPYYRGVIEHEQYDDWWDSYSLRNKYGEMAVPALFITGWYDSLLHENFKLFNGWTEQARTDNARKQTKLIVGPWSHQVSPWGRLPLGDNGEYQDRTFGQQALWDVIDMHTHWYDQRLKGVNTGIDQDPPIKLFVMGKNQWRYETEWPLARTEWTRFYLHSAGDAASKVDGSRRILPPLMKPPTGLPTTLPTRCHRGAPNTRASIGAVHVIAPISNGAVTC